MLRLMAFLDLCVSSTRWSLLCSQKRCVSQSQLAAAVSRPDGIPCCHANDESHIDASDPVYMFSWHTLLPGLYWLQTLTLLCWSQDRTPCTQIQRTPSRGSAEWPLLCSIDPRLARIWRGVSFSLLVPCLSLAPLVWWYPSTMAKSRESLVARIGIREPKN